MSQELPKLVKDKVEDYRIANLINKQLEEMHEDEMNIYQMMRDWNKWMAKCNGYDYVNGIKKYCTSFTYSGGMVIQTKDVFSCSHCSKARSCYCNKHASGKLYNCRLNATIICKECIKNSPMINKDHITDWENIEEKEH
jgi:hypothetical protein